MNWRAHTPNGKRRRCELALPDAVPQDVVTGISLPEGLATDGAYQADAMYRVGVCGGAPERRSPVVSAHDSQATDVYSVNSTYVYWVAGRGFGDSKTRRVAQ